MRNGPIGLLYRRPNPAAPRTLRQIQIADELEHVARIHEADDADIAPDRHAKLGVENHQRVAADGKAVLIEGLRRAESIQGKAADRRIAAREEPLARRNVLHRDGERLAIGPEERLPVVIDTRDLLWKPVGEAEPRSGREHDALLSRQPSVHEGLHEGLEEADLRSHSPGGQLGIQSDQLPASRIESIVARIADERSGDRGQPDLRKQTIDQGLVGGPDALVEQAGRIEVVSAREADP